jgi:hypothetical protein
MNPAPLRPDVPVFNCVVNLARTESGTFIGRVANLTGIQARGPSERNVIAQLVAEFKAQVAGYHAAGEGIPFIEPPAPPAHGETQRLIAVHL